MSTYSIYRLSEKVLATCDGKPIKLTPMIDDAIPLFDFGNNSTGSYNLAHAILAHCVGPTCAKSVAESFMRHYLGEVTHSPWTLSSLEIGCFAKQSMKYKPGFRMEKEVTQDVA